MKKFSKSSVLCLSAAAALSTVALAGPAAAQFYGRPVVTNGSSTDTVSISGASWSGSYNPQVAATINPLASSSGALRTVSSFGYSGLSFTATLNDGSGKSCYFTFNVSNTTGALAGIGAVAGNGATCTHSGNTYEPYIYFTIAP